MGGEQSVTNSGGDCEDGDDNETQHDVPTPLTSPCILCEIEGTFSLFYFIMLSSILSTSGSPC